MNENYKSPSSDSLLPGACAGRRDCGGAIRCAPESAGCYGMRRVSFFRVWCSAGAAVLLMMALVYVASAATEDDTEYYMDGTVLRRRVRTHEYTAEAAAAVHKILDVPYEYKRINVERLETEEEIGELLERRLRVTNEQPEDATARDPKHRSDLGGTKLSAYDYEERREIEQVILAKFEEGVE